MSNKPAPCIVLFVANVARCTAFYCEIAKMTRLHEESSYAILECNGLELVIHAFYGSANALDSAEEPPTVREDSCFKLCLPVTSIENARAIAPAWGGHIKPQESEWESRGIRACDGHDPEGNVIQVRQSVV